MMWFSWLMPLRMLAFSFSSWVLPPAEPNATLEEVFGMEQQSWNPEPGPTDPAAQKRALDSLAKRCRNLLLDPRAKVQPGQGIGVTLDPEEKDAFESLKEFTDAFAKLCLDNGMSFVTFIDYPANIWDKKKSGEAWSVIIKLAPVRTKSEPKVD